MRTITLILFISLCAASFAQKKKSEKGTYKFVSTEVVFVETIVTFDPKKNAFTSQTEASASMRDFKENLHGYYQRKKDTLFLDFEYSKTLISPLLNCKELERNAKPCMCRDTLYFRKDSIGSKDKVIWVKRVP